MKLILHGIFARDYGPSVTIEAGSVAEALEAWSRQVGFYDDRLTCDRPAARVIGFDSEEALRAPTDVGEVHVVPAMFGGGGKFTQIIIGAIMVVAGILLSPAFPMVGTALIVAGVTTIIGGVLNLFVKAPTANKANDPAASLYLGAAGMTTAIGTPIGLCVGRVKRAGQAMSLDVTSNSLTFVTFPGA